MITDLVTAPLLATRDTVTPPPLFTNNHWQKIKIMNDENDNFDWPFSVSFDSSNFDSLLLSSFPPPYWLIYLLFRADLGRLQAEISCQVGQMLSRRAPLQWWCQVPWCCWARVANDGEWKWLRWCSILQQGLCKDVSRPPRHHALRPAEMIGCVGDLIIGTYLYLPFH